jgi:predicted ATPase
MDLAPQWLAEVARLLPDLLYFPHIPMPTQPADESRLWESLHRLFHALARLRTVCFFLDDLHWADTATLGWLGYIARRTASPALILLAAARPVEGHSSAAALFQALTREDRLALVLLSPLSATDIRAMADHLAASSLCRSDCLRRGIAPLRPAGTCRLRRVYLGNRTGGRKRLSG